MAAEWDRQPGETPKSFAAFCVYLKLPPGERTLAKVSAAIGHAGTSGVELWSSKYDWVNRVKAYDDFTLTTAITVRMTDLAGAQAAQIQQMSLITAAAMQFGSELLTDMRNKYNKDNEIDTRAYQRVARTLIDLDTAARRTLGMPTNFKTEAVAEPHADGEVYYVGMSDDD